MGCCYFQSHPGAVGLLYSRDITSRESYWFISKLVEPTEYFNSFLHSVIASYSVCISVTEEMTVCTPTQLVVNTVTVLLLTIRFAAAGNPTTVLMCVFCAVVETGHKL